MPSVRHLVSGRSLPSMRSTQVELGGSPSENRSTQPARAVIRRKGKHDDGRHEWNPPRSAAGKFVLKTVTCDKSAVQTWHLRPTYLYKNALFVQQICHM